MKVKRHFREFLLLQTVALRQGIQGIHCQCSEMSMVSEMANVVVFQPFSYSKLQYSERWSCEALREKEELHVKLNLSRIRSKCPGRCSTNQNAPFYSINSSLICENNGIGRRIISSVQPRLVIEQQSTVVVLLPSL